MTAPETPDELRARLGELADAATEGPLSLHVDKVSTRLDGYVGLCPNPIARFYVHMEADAALIVALVNAWPAIDALLAELQLIKDNDRVWGAGNWIKCENCPRTDIPGMPAYHHKNMHNAALREPS